MAPVHLTTFLALQPGWLKFTRSWNGQGSNFPSLWGHPNTPDPNLSTPILIWMPPISLCQTAPGAYTATLAEHYRTRLTATLIYDVPGPLPLPGSSLPAPVYHCTLIRATSDLLLPPWFTAPPPSHGLALPHCFMPPSAHHCRLQLIISARVVDNG